MRGPEVRIICPERRKGVAQSPLCWDFSGVLAKLGSWHFSAQRWSPPRPIPNVVYNLGPGSATPTSPVLPSSFLQVSVLTSDLPQFLVTCPEVPASLLCQQRPLCWMRDARATSHTPYRDCTGQSVPSRERTVIQHCYTGTLQCDTLLVPRSGRSGQDPSSGSPP